MSGPQLTDKTLDVLEAVGRLGEASMTQIQQRCQLPAATAYRIMQALVDRRFLLRVARGKFRLGHAISNLRDQMADRETLTEVARPHLHALSRKTRCHAHLGVWEGDMVTYLVKQRYGKSRLHSAEGMQLEAYCSALGKILLSGLRDEALEAYLREGPFVALTPRTIVEPAMIREEIARVRAAGFATDEEEISPGLRCIAAAVKDGSGHIVAAVSVSNPDASGCREPMENFRDALRDVVGAIGGQLFPGRRP